MRHGSLLVVWVWSDVGTRVVEEALEWREGGFAVAEDVSILGFISVGLLGSWTVEAIGTAGSVVGSVVIGGEESRR